MSFGILNVICVFHDVDWSFAQHQTDWRIETANKKEDFNLIKEIIDAVLKHEDKPHIEFGKEAET